MCVLLGKVARWHRDLRRLHQMPIQLLSSQVIDQIAAGEVVERPASAVKELVENAIDAGATRLVIEIEEGGRDLLRIQDDGHGIPHEELALAVTAHATSKIGGIADLERVSTLGFRGEALAAIGSVSRLSLTSKPASQSSAGRIEVNSGLIAGPMPAAGKCGTCVEVRNLFGSIPARRKFLKSAGAEAARIVEVVLAAALPRPEVSFEVTSGGRTLLRLNRAAGLRARTIDALGDELDPHLLTVSGVAVGDSGESVSVDGFVGTPDTARGSSKWLRIYMNGRPIIDRSLQHAVREGFRGLIEPGAFPVAVLFVACPPSLVDVNVHPAKTEVRFRQPSLMHRLVHAAVRDALAVSDIVPVLSPRQMTWGGVNATAAPLPFAASVLANSPAEAAASTTDSLSLSAIAAGRLLQVNRTWLVFEEAGALVVVDQHALHERVLFEEFLARVQQGDLESQPLLVPQIFAADAAAIERVEAMGALLLRLGIDLRQASPRSLALHAVPTLLASRGVDALDFAKSLVENESSAGARLGDSASATGSEVEAALAEVLDMMACKAAVKAGDTLTASEASALLARRVDVERSSRCPHGRPTSMRIPLVELERRFGRR